jgi:hypothetical protein
MIRWLWSRMMKWGWDFNHNLREDNPVYATASLGSSFDDGIELSDPMTFRIQTVLGGTLIETSYFQRKSEERRSKIYVVTPDENLSDAVGKIVTMELLQK